MTFTVNFERFYSLTLKRKPEKRKPFSKKLEYRFLVKVLRSKIFIQKLLCHKSMLRQIDCGVQNGPITKNGVLPLTTSFFQKFCFSLKTLYKELI